MESGDVEQSERCFGPWRLGGWVELGESDRTFGG
jgi:hypothetical protein